MGQQDPQAGACPLVGELGPGLAPSYWWVETGLESLVAGPWRSWSWGQPTGGQGPGGLGLVPPHSPVSEAGPQAVTGPLIRGAGYWGSWAYCERAGVGAGSRVLRWTGLGPGYLWAHGVFRWQAWGLHPSSNKLEREFHSGVGQCQCPHGGTSVPQWPSPVSHVIRVSSSCLLPPQEPLQDQQMGLTQDFFKWLLLPWVLECVEICVCSLFPTALVLLKVSPAGLHSQMFGDLSSQAGPLGWGVSVGLWPLAPWEAALQL